MVGRDGRPGDMIMWDNRCVMHRREAFDPNTVRVMHRATVEGQRPPTASRAEFGASRHGLAGGLGFEPRPAESESAVLPLDDPPTKGGAEHRETGAGCQRLAPIPKRVTLS
jgi:hypothetical protein